MAKRIFLLGAGFSKEAGLPLGNELIDFILNKLKNSANVLDTGDTGFYQEISDFLKGIQIKFPELIEDVELLFTEIDLALIGNFAGLFKDIGFSIEDLRMFRMKLSGALVRAFEYAHFEFSYERAEKILERREDANQIFWKFCQNLNKEDTVITFNYDLIIEKGLWLQNKWTFLDGYGLNKNINDFQDTWGGRYPSDKPIESFVKVYKPHGSLGWVYDDSSGQIIFMPNYFPGYTGLFCEKNLHTAGARWDEGTTFIEPSYIKQFDRPIILDIWEKAFHEIQQSNELIIIGYSLPEADTAARIFLATGVRSSQILSITVVNLSNEVFDKFEGLFGRKVLRKRMSFKEWVENEI